MPVEDPELALCDGPQQLYAADFPAFASEVAAHAQLSGRSLAYKTASKVAPEVECRLNEAEAGWSPSVVATLTGWR